MEVQQRWEVDWRWVLFPPPPSSPLEWSKKQLHVSIMEECSPGAHREPRQTEMPQHSEVGYGHLCDQL